MEQRTTTLRRRAEIAAQVEGRIIDLGCGEFKRDPEYIGVDILDYPGVDIVGDVFEVLGAVPDGSLAGLYSAHFFEHVEDLPRLIGEIGRVIRPKGQLEVITPHFSNPYYYSDSTHRTTFGLYSFSYWAVDNLLRRKVLSYQRQPAFELSDIDLRFKSPPPFVIRYGFKRVAGAIVNLTTWGKEFYEENLCQIFPCYELDYRLTRLAIDT